MRLPRFAATTVLIVGAVGLAGCTSPNSVPEASTPSPSRTAVEAAPSTAPPSSSTASPTEPAPTITPGAYVDFTDGAIESTAGPKALFFHASWCPQCRALDDDLKTAGAPDGLTVFKVDYDSRTDLRQKYGVTLQTTIVFVDDTGEPLSSAVLYDDPSVASLVAAMP